MLSDFRILQYCHLSPPLILSSDGEDSDGEAFLTPVDIDLPFVSASNNDALIVTAHRFATLGRGCKKPRQVLVFEKIHLSINPFTLHIWTSLAAQTINYFY
ncbi:hypothetical protein Fmac_002339 [Flemingia macrophylla]|uniref:Uncharacterized protein n=1 Tax=Flemingia macrophylla TaxID=520843 RepID=A0ABD1NJN5_9FABA